MKIIKIKNTLQHGFTLIELMITVAIVGILSAIALPAYQDYMIRAQITEGLSLANGTKTYIVDYFTNRGGFPADNAAVGFPGASGSFVIQSVEISGDSNSATVTSTFAGDKVNEKLRDKSIILEVEKSSISENLIWTCKSEDIEDKYLPANCRQ